MTLVFFRVITILLIIVFLVMMLITKEDKNKVYIKYVLLAYPFMDWNIPIEYGMTLFDALTYGFVFTLYIPKHRDFKSGNLYLFLFISLLLASIIGCVIAKSLELYTVKAFIGLGSAFLFAKVLIDECLTDTLIHYKILKWLKISLIVSLIFLGFQMIFGVKVTIALTQNPNIVNQGIRYFSYFSDPQLYAQFLTVVSFIFLIKENEGSKLPVQNYLFFFICLIAMVLTGARGGFAGWGLGLIIIFIFSNSNFRIATIIACIMLFFVVYSLADSLVIFKRTSIADSYDFRYAIWQEAFDIFTDHPVFGIGLGNYRNYISVHNPDQVWMIDGEFVFMDHPESLYLKYLTEVGLLGFTSIMLLILVPIFNAFKLLIKTRDTTVVFLIASLASWLVATYTVFSFSDVRIVIIIITIVCLLITSYQRIIPDNAKESI